MYSPYEAFYGFDRTHIKRLTPQEYMNEKENPTNGSGLLTSRDPNVQFCSKFPVQDRFGRELCVLYQILEMEIQQELRRVEKEGDMTRKSGVRLSAEITFDDTNDESLKKEPQNHQYPSHNKKEQVKVEKEEEEGEERLSIYRPTPFVPVPVLSAYDEDIDDINVSASSHLFSAVTTSLPRGTNSSTARVSSFSIYRDSGVNPCTKLPESRGVNSQHQRSDIVSDGSHSTFTSQGFLVSDGDHICINQNFKNQYPLFPPPQRSNTASPTRVICGNENNNVNNDLVGLAQSNEEEEEEEDGALGVTRVTLNTTAGTDPLRFTTVRPSELRTTKQLFAPGRTTTTTTSRRTIKHANPISSQSYGLHSQNIASKIVAPLIAANLEAFCSDKSNDGNSEFYNFDGPAPNKLIPGSEIILGEHRYHILHYYTSSDVYEGYKLPRVNPSQQVLLYRWSIRAIQQGINESHRAVLGLSLASSYVYVTGYKYIDGGFTVITLPSGYHAVPLSTIPLSPRSFPTCAKLLLRMLSDLIVKRTIHGNLRALNHIFLAFRSPDITSEMPIAVLVPVHWERLIDFSMFVDRNAGRTIPMSYDDDYDNNNNNNNSGNRKGERVYHAQDVSMIVNMLLENELAENLQSEQILEMQRLMMMTTEPTQVANYLIQLKNTMTVIPSDISSLRKEYEMVLQGLC